MKELKHLMYLESLLEDANNDLVRRAQAEGGLAIGYTCFHAPEALLNLGNCFSVRLRAPHTNSMDLATYYMANNSCEYARALLERALEGNFAFLHAMIGVDVCEANNRAMENMELMHVQGDERPDFFWSNLDVPYSDDEDCVAHTVEQVSRKILKPLRENYGVDTSDAAIRKAVAEQNEISRVLTELGELRKLDNPPITGYEYAVLVLASYVCPKALIADTLRETLEEVRQRESDGKKSFRVRLAIVGSEIDDPGLIKLIEGCGALVVADRFCYGSVPGRQEIPLSDGEDALTQVCRWYLQNTECPRQCAAHRVQRRYDRAAELARAFKADGIIYEQMKVCTYWSYERTMASHIMPDEYGIRVLSIDRPYSAGESGQLRTRVQAFIESLEIKKLRAAAEEEKTV
ncbi:MAG: 2-hydroxyacyl-CoA dehydratase family protein [Oscillospiraceae bacterium]|nr:2-hydroxyacyl-CoA dehydratase family protein [Oscillospiraceae bacterium]